MTENLDTSLRPAEPDDGTQLPAAQPHFGSRPPSEAGGLIDIRRYVAALKRFKWLIMVAPFFGLGVGLLVSRIMKPDYVSSAMLWIESPGQGEQRGPQIGPIRQQQLLSAGSWVELLKSSLVLDTAVYQLEMYVQPRNAADSTVLRGLKLLEAFRKGGYRLELDPAADSATLFVRTLFKNIAVERVAIGDSIGRSMGLLWAPPAEALARGARIDFDIQAPRIVSRGVSRKMRASIDPSGNFLRIELTGKDRESLPRIVNTVVTRYVSVAAELKREKLTELAHILDQQLRQAEGNLRDAENALESFRVQTITLPGERATPVSPGLQQTQAPVLSNFFTMRIDLDNLRQDAQAISRALKQASDTIPIEALSAVGAVQTSELMVALRELTDKRAELRSMRYRYTSEHPPLRQLAAAIDTIEKRTIPSLSGLLLSELAARETDLSGRIASASRELQQIPPRVIQEARLDRQVRIADNLFTMLQHRYEEAKLAEVSSIPDVRVLENAVVPQEPVKNLFIFLLLGGLAGGFGLAVVLALLLDQIDRRVRYPAQVTTGLGLPILGAVPHVNAKVNGAGTGPLVEAFRGLQLNLVYAEGNSGPLVVTVTSPGAGDGKSFVACNLALAFADAGYRTVLVDGDLRRSVLHRLLSAPESPGLSDVLSGNALGESVAQETEFGGLHFIPSGNRMSRAPDLLSSGRIAKLLTGLRERYSVIVVDSPPLGAGMDAYALAAATGNMLVVLRTGTTDREDAESKLQVVDRFPIRIFGAVMNDVREGRMYGSYSYYMAGYEREGESYVGTHKKVLGAGRQSRGA
jgi:polysaccharide biosynthesis transport protein